MNKFMIIIKPPEIGILSKEVKFLCGNCFLSIKKENFLKKKFIENIINKLKKKKEKINI
jgi:hypothetical protein